MAQIGMQTYTESDNWPPWSYLDLYGIGDPTGDHIIEFQYAGFLVAQLPAYYLIQFLPLESVDRHDGFLTR